jgi:hypothetical protein
VGGPKSAIGQGPPITGGEAAMICCPTGYTVTPGLTRNCVSSKGSGKVTAVAVQIRWRERDLVLLETDPLRFGMKGESTVGIKVSARSTAASATTTSSLASSSILSSSASSVPAATNGSIAETPSPSRGMSTGAKAGIGAGTGLALVFLLTCLLYFIRRHPRRSKEAKRAAELDDPSVITAHLSAGNEKLDAVHEMPHYEPAEMPNTTQGATQSEAMQASPLSSHPISPPVHQSNPQAPNNRGPDIEVAPPSAALTNEKDTEMKQLKTEEERMQPRLRDLENS